MSSSNSLAEAQSEQAVQQDRARQITLAVNRIVHAVAKHWLLLANGAIAVYTALPVVPPVLMAAGRESLAKLAYALFAPLCHQLPERSFFLFGEKAAYTLAELQGRLGPDVPLRYLGNPMLGFKIAICQRDVAMNVAALLTGLAFALLHRRWRPISIRTFILLCLPMAIDGFGQLLSWWESTWWSRVITGGLFGAACVLLAFPYIEAGMKDVRQVIPTDGDPTLS